MKHVVVTRAYFEDDALFESYYKTMKEVYFPSLGAQTNSNFNLLIHANERHCSSIIQELNKHGIKNYSVAPDIKNIEHRCMEYNIQTRHDCDDYMGPTYVEKIQNAYITNIMNCDTFIVYAVGTKYDLKTKSEYTIPNATIPTSPECTAVAGMGFLSVCQKFPKIWVYQTSHQSLVKLVPDIIYIQEYGIVRWVIHGSNKMGKIRPRDKMYKMSDNIDLFPRSNMLAN